jgi:hypothetical protein
MAIGRVVSNTPNWRAACYSEKWSVRCFYGRENSTIKMRRKIAPSSNQPPVIAEGKSQRAKDFARSATRGDGKVPLSFKRVDLSLARYEPKVSRHKN